MSKLISSIGIQYSEIILKPDRKFIKDGFFHVTFTSTPEGTRKSDLPSASRSFLKDMTLRGSPSLARGKISHHVILFNDALLLCKMEQSSPKRSKSKTVTKKFFKMVSLSSVTQVLAVDKVMIEIVGNEDNMVSFKMNFEFPSVVIRDAWIKELNCLRTK